MTDELINKLNSALSNSTPDEAQVGFILSKIRKIIEREKEESNFPILDFYIDWSLHSTINRTGRVAMLMDEIEKTILGENYDPSVAIKLIDFEEFQKQIKRFLDKYHIINPFSKKDYWRKFRSILVDILKECPLLPKNGEITKLCFVGATESNIKCIIYFKSHHSIELNFSFINY